MATLTSPDTDLVAFLAPGAVNQFELHLLCTWGTITHHGEECACARLIRIRTETEFGHHQVVSVIEPGATHDEFWATVEWVDEYTGPLVINDFAWRVALASC